MKDPLGTPISFTKADRPLRLPSGQARSQSNHRPRMDSCDDDRNTL